MAQLSGVACGAISDHFGPQATIALGGSLVSSCLLGLGWLDPPAEQAWLLVAVYAVLTFGCFLLLFSSFSCAFIWRAQQATILTCANVFFDASASVSLLLYQLYDTAGLSRGPLLTGYAALAATAAAAQILLWVPNTAMLRAAKQAAPGGEAPAQQQGDAEGAEQPLLQGEQGTPRQQQQQQGGGGLWAQLRSADFAFLATFGAAHVFRSIVFMGTFSSLLWQYGDEAAGYRYTKLFSAELPTCVLFIPAVSWTLRHCSWATTFQAWPARRRRHSPIRTPPLSRCLVSAHPPPCTVRNGGPDHIPIRDQMHQAGQSGVLARALGCASLRPRGW